MLTTPSLRTLRYDSVGSLLRPEPLKQAYACGGQEGFDHGRLRATQDAAVREVIATQVAHGYPVVSDGEFRRRVFVESFAEVSGFDHWRDRYRGAGAGIQGRERSSGAVTAPSRRLRVPATGRLALRRNALLEEFSFAQELTDVPVKVTLLGPDRIFHTFDPDGSRGVYDDSQQFLDDVVAVERDIIRGLVDAGCRYIQMDAPGYTAYVDPDSCAGMRERGLEPREVMRRTIRAENAVIAGFPEVTFGIHVCRGNEQGRWHREGAYDEIAEQLFDELNHDRLLLEYDTERAGTFDALRFVPGDKIVVLGLVTTKSADLETVDQLKRRIEQASAYLPVEQLAVSPQCGFSSGLAGNPVTISDQWRKLDVCLETAVQVWG